MAKLDIDLSSIDLSSTSTGGGWRALPTGSYRAAVTKSTLAENSKGTGQVLTLFLSILDGDDAGTELRDYLSVVHKNETAQRISQEKLAHLAQACGLHVISDSAELHNVPVLIDVACVDEPDERYGDRNGKKNVIRAYASVSHREARTETHSLDNDIPF